MNIIPIARSMIGTPYMHQGRLPGVGLDCIGLAIAVARAVGMDPQDVKRYRRIPDGAVLKASLDAHLIERDGVNEMFPGDVILMNFRDGGHPQHVAIFTGDSIIHSYSLAGKVVEHGFGDIWRDRVLAVYGWPEGYN